ncbi:MAG TPA: hypothetical protein VMP68_04160 [Candidatus Eisenbacteria bacterium]|nr:hypothetical protein [Candidatus Eisenbacteria bacterium]
MAETSFLERNSREYHGTKSVRSEHWSESAIWCRRLLDAFGAVMRIGAGQSRHGGNQATAFDFESNRAQ